MHARHFLLLAGLLLACLSCISCREIMQTSASTTKTKTAPSASTGASTAAQAGSSTASEAVSTSAAGGSQTAALNTTAAAAGANTTAAAAAGANKTAAAAAQANKTAANITDQPYSTYYTELGSSIIGRPFVAGACGSKPSALGYQCSWAAPQGVILHWSYNTSHPPVNRCTGNNAVGNNETLLSNMTGEVVVHFALQAATREKLHVAFVEPAARYFPAEGVHGWGHCTKGRCNSSSPPEVEVLYFDGPGSSVATGWRVASNTSSTHDTMGGWASWPSAHFDGMTGVLCFSRLAHSKLMRTGANIMNDATITYAVNNRSSYTIHTAPRAGMAYIDFKTGQAKKAELPMGMMAVHGALMIVAFAVLLPAGLLVSRHKWLFVEQEQGGGLSPWWALSHMVLLVLGASAGLAGMIVALVVFGNSGSGILMSTHQVLGLISIGMSLVLVAMYGLRPFINHHPGHSHPLLGPQKTTGWLTVLAGWTTLFLGCVVVHYSWAVPLKTWMTPVVTICALMACAGVALELRFQKLVRSGIYNPKTFTISNIAPLPLARIRAGRQPWDPKKKEAPSFNDGGSQHGCSGSGGLEDGSPVGSAGSRGSGQGFGGAAGTMLSRMDFRGPLGQIIREARGSRGSSAGSGGSSPGSADSLHFRRGRQSSASSNAGGVVTGFPGERPFATTEHV